MFKISTVDKEERLLISYFGKKLLQTNDYYVVETQNRLNDVNAGIYNAAYTPSGTWNMLEPALQVTHSDGNKSLELKYVSHQIKEEDENIITTSIRLKDPVYPFEVILYYKVFKKENVVEQWSELQHQEKSSVILEKYASANLYFMAENYYLTHYHGGWGRELKPEQTLLTAGIKTLDSKLGTRTNLFQPPSFMLSFDRTSNEEEGNVLLGTLAWSGNFKMDFEVDSYHNLRLIVKWRESVPLIGAKVYRFSGG